MITPLTPSYNCNGTNIVWQKDIIKMAEDITQLCDEYLINPIELDTFVRVADVGDVVDVAPNVNDMFKEEVMKVFTTHFGSVSDKYMFLFKDTLSSHVQALLSKRCNQYLLDESLFNNPIKQRYCIANGIVQWFEVNKDSIQARNSFAIKHACSNLVAMYETAQAERYDVNAHVSNDTDRECEEFEEFEECKDIEYSASSTVVIKDDSDEDTIVEDTIVDNACKDACI